MSFTDEAWIEDGSTESEAKMKAVLAMIKGEG
jgi:hypothetical protein